MTVTAVLLSWKRPNNIPLIVGQLEATGIVSEILVWNNNPDLMLRHPSIIAVNSSHNFKAYARLGLAMMAKNDTIMFHDDDLLFRPEDIIALHRLQQAAPHRIHGFMGRNLKGGQYAREKAFGDVDIVLGQFMLFSKELLAQANGDILRLTPFERGDDIALSLLSGGKHFCMDVPRKNLDPGQVHGLFRAPDHFEKRQLMVNRALALREARQK
ncbi:hypothetical protein [Aestuariivirga sp.]|uniref:hypothetical protein n=1 Tax=Aestuariivirga sp. TaxID=2650926 RepID=UPI0039E5E2B5